MFEIIEDGEISSKVTIQKAAKQSLEFIKICFLVGFLKQADKGQTTTVKDVESTFVR